MTQFDIISFHFKFTPKGQSLSWDDTVYKEANGTVYADKYSKGTNGYAYYPLARRAFDGPGYCNTSIYVSGPIYGTPSAKWKDIKDGQFRCWYEKSSYADTVIDEKEATLIQGGGIGYTHQVRIVKDGVESDGGSTTCTYYNGKANGSNSWTYSAREKSGDYAFKNFTNASGFTVFGRSVTIPYSAQDVTVYANYVPVFDIVFSANDGTETTSTQSGIVTESDVKLNANTFTRSGYIFSGWSLSASAATADFADKSSADAVFDASGVSAGATVTLYAVWRRPTVYITNGDPSKGTLSLYRGTSIVSSAKIADEANGVLMSDAALGTYTVLCTPPSGVKLYRGKGLGTGDTAIEYSATTDAANRNVTTFTLNADTPTVELGFYYLKLATYTIGISALPTGSGSVIVQKMTDGGWPTDGRASPPDETVNNVGYWLPQLLRVIVTPTEGYEISRLWVSFGVNVQPDIENPNPAGTQLDLTWMSENAVIHVEFSHTRHTVGVSVDAPSAAVGEAIVTKDGEPVEGKVEYGDTVTFTANVKSAAGAGYSFEGWYRDGQRVSTAATYAHTVEGDISLVAKFAARVRLSLAFTDNREGEDLPTIVENGSLSVDGLLLPTSAYDAAVALGRTIAYAVTPGSMGAGLGTWSFNAWYAASDSSYADPLPHPKDGSFTIASPLDLVARLTSVKIESRVRVRVWVNGYEEGGVVHEGQFVTPDENNPHITSELGVVDADNLGYLFTVDGSQDVRLTAERTSITVDGRTATFRYFAKDTDNEEADILSRNVNYVRFLNQPPSANDTVYAIYGEPGPVRTTLAYANGNPAAGTLAIGDVSNDETGAASVSATIQQGQEVTIVAKAKNGYKFVGWYFGGVASGAPDSVNTTETVVVTSERTILADFQRDRAAIYEWEGSAESKEAAWKSKVYVAQKPFNPSAARVDVTDPRGRQRVTFLKVGMASSPDAEPTAVTEITDMPTYVARRLPKRRPERYLQVEVRNDAEVDRIIVGTSMEGLAV